MPLGLISLLDFVGEIGAPVFVLWLLN